MMTIREMVSDEFREGYAAFGLEELVLNPYEWGVDNEYLDWDAGYTAAYLDWKELIGEKSV